MIGVYFNMNPTTSSQTSAGLTMNKSQKTIKITGLTGKKLQIGTLSQLQTLSPQEGKKIAGGDRVGSSYPALRSP